jgi:tRNA threonylcarbamoyladenosine biosynthesis protein TsaE
MDISDIEGLRRFAGGFARQLAPSADAATLVTLSGELGAGKTTFVQAVAKALGVEESVTSPTFVIEKIYHLPAQAGLQGEKFKRLIHIDAYRLEKSHELEALGFEELLRDPANLILLEWPERVSDLIPKDAMKVRFDIAGDGRTISIDGKETSRIG